MNRYRLVAGAVIVTAAACGREGAPRPTAVAPPSAASPPPAASSLHTEGAASDTPRRRVTNGYSPDMPGSDPVGPPRPQCPDIASLVKASAVMKHEYPSDRRRPVPPSVLDVELTITIVPNPGQVSFAGNQTSVFGGVLVEEMFQPATPGKDVLLIRPMGGVARETSLLVLFGLVCKDKAAHGTLRVPMKAAIPWRDGDPVTVTGILGS